MPPPDPDPTGPSDPTGPTILVVDDDEMVRSFATRLLARHGFEVLAAASGAEAIALLERQPERVDAVLLDLTMPGLSGEQTGQRLRDRVPDLPLVLTSGYGPPEPLDSDGPTAFLQKPYNAAALLDGLRQVLDA